MPTRFTPTVGLLLLMAQMHLSQVQVLSQALRHYQAQCSQRFQSLHLMLYLVASSLLLA